MAPESEKKAADWLKPAGLKKETLSVALALYGSFLGAGYDILSYMKWYEKRTVNGITEPPAV